MITSKHKEVKTKRQTRKQVEVIPIKCVIYCLCCKENGIFQYRIGVMIYKIRPLD